MSCYFPNKAYRSLVKNENGKFPMIFRPGVKAEIDVENPIMLPCGKCNGCMLDRARDWAIRCVHESELYDDNSFVTLTYNDANLPPNGSLNKRHFSLFMKRLRKRFSDVRIRFFQCGEYGEEFNRPHHHAILFNIDFPDKYLWREKGDNRYYRSEILEELWPYGNSEIGDVTFDSASYVARYVLKKLNIDDKEAHYRGRVPEYITMSRRPGIGHDWISRYLSDVYPSDRVVVRGKLLCLPPRYYDKLYDLTDSAGCASIKESRIKHARANPDNSPHRLLARSVCADAKLKQFKTRSFEKNEVKNLRYS